MKKTVSLLTFLALVFGTMVAPAANADDASTAAITDSSSEVTPEPQPASTTETTAEPIATVAPEPSPSASVPATEPPLVPTGFIARSSADDIALLWDPIDFQSAEVPLVDTYIIRELLTQQTVEVAGTQQSYVFENLDSAIVYEFQIAARNSAGTSDFSEIARASIESSTDLKDISRLIVKYRDDVSPTLGNGKPTGSESLDVEVEAGREIGAGMRTVVLDDPITTNKAGEVVDTLNDDPRIEWAEPDVFISLSAVNNDEPSGAITLTPSGSSISQTVSNVGANYSPSIYSYGRYSDTWYKFVAPETRYVTATINSGGTLSDPVLSAYTSSYGFIAYNDDYNGLMPRIQFNVTAGQTYYIAFSSYDYAAQGTGNLVISNLTASSPTPSAPTITSVTSQVNALTANWTSATTGSAATSFTANAYSNSSLTNLAATCSTTSWVWTCQLTGLTGGATYWVTVTATNSSGSAISSAVSGVAQLSRNSTPETAAELGTITYPFRTIVSNSDFPQTYVNSVGNSPAWYAFTAASSGLVDMRISPSWGTNYDPMLAVFAANNLSSRLAFDDDSNGSYKPRVSFNVVAGQRYLVAFSSYRSFSTGTGELTATFTSISATVPGVPVSVSATSTQNSITANWSPPSSNGGSPITGYQASVYDSSGTFVGQCQTTALACTISPLSPGTTYQLRVKASNAFGYGGESTSTTVTTPSPSNADFSGAINLGTVTSGYSGTVSNINGTSTVTCSGLVGSSAAWYKFTAGSSGQATLEITSHQGMTDSMLFVYDSNRVALGCNDDSAGGFRPRLTLSVTSGTTYFVALASYGNTFRGNANLQISLGANTPSAPQNVSVLSGNESLVVNWSPPNFSGTSSVYEYEATAYSALDSSVAVSQCSTDGSATSCRITGLQNNTEYFVSVSATNSSGTGNSSGRISGTPAFIRVPNSPAGVTVTTGVSLLQVSWQSVDTANIEPVIDYTATAYTASGSAANSCTTTATSCSIASLTSGTTYYVSVTARNTVGSGSPSSLVSGMAGYPPNWTPSDPSYVNGTLWGLNGRYGVSAPGAWTRTRGAASVVVAVIDTGGTSHPDLNANTVAGYDFISSSSSSADGDGWDSDASDPGDGGGSRSSWHGTHVAGTIGAVSDSSGVVGVAPSTTMQHIRVLGTRGGSIADIASGIIWASGGSVPGIPINRTPAKVINMSLGGPSYSCESTFQSAINTAVSRGTTVVVAAGNDDEDARYSSPANCNNVITVAAITSSGNRADFSNYGSVVDIAAPGVNIYSTINSGYSSPSSPSWTSYQGTSMAAPHVAGVVALMLANNPSLSPQAIEANIKSSSNVTAFAGNRCDAYYSFVTCGTGVINAARLLGSTYDPSVAPAPPTLTPTSPSNASTAVTIARNQKISSKAFAARASIPLPAKHKVKLTVVGSKKVCKISGGKVVALKPGACRVKVTVSGKVKVGKKMKMKKNSTMITVSVS